MVELFSGPSVSFHCVHVWVHVSSCQYYLCAEPSMHHTQLHLYIFIYFVISVILVHADTRRLVAVVTVLLL